jgi:hypothetical protein
LLRHRFVIGRKRPAKKEYLRRRPGSPSGDAEKSELADPAAEAAAVKAAVKKSRRHLNATIPFTKNKDSIRSNTPSRIEILQPVSLRAGGVVHPT